VQGRRIVDSSVDVPESSEAKQSLGGDATEGDK
jgi:hypothetical protein